MRKKTSVIWKMPKDDFANLVKSSNSIADILRHFKYSVTGSAHKLVKSRIVSDNIDASHILLGRRSNLGRKMPSSLKIPLNCILVENSTYNRTDLKKRLLVEGLLKNKCAICDCPPQWNAKQLVMVLDHENGIRNDNRIHNLRLLCPNCNSQQPTFAGKNKRSCCL